MKKPNSSKWDQGRLSNIAKVLGHYRSIQEALPQIQEKVEGCADLTYPALKDAFRRHYGNPPSSFLKRPLAEEARDELLEKIEAREVSKERKQAGLNQILLDKIEYALRKIGPITVQANPEPPPTKTSGPSEIIWAEISDVQLGTWLKASEIGNLNSHDWIVGLEKLRLWKDRLKEIIRERLAINPVDSVVLAFLGDICEGHDIFSGQPYHLDKDVVSQVILGAEDFAQALAEILAEFPHTYFSIYGVYGNHGRVGRKGESPASCNFDRLLYHLIELRLAAAQPKLTNYECKFEEAFFQVVETRGGLTHLLVHGDDIKGWGGLPFYGLQRAVAKYGMMLQRPVNYLHCGHHHTEAAMSSGVGECLVNGNWIGASMFSAKILVEANVPAQMVHGFAEGYGLTWSQKIYLKTRDEMRPKVKIYRPKSLRKVS